MIEPNIKLKQAIADALIESHCLPPPGEKDWEPVVSKILANLEALKWKKLYFELSRKATKMYE